MKSGRGSQNEISGRRRGEAELPSPGAANWLRYRATLLPAAFAKGAGGSCCWPWGFLPGGTLTGMGATKVYDGHQLRAENFLLPISATGVMYSKVAGIEQ